MWADRGGLPGEGGAAGRHLGPKAASVQCDAFGKELLEGNYPVIVKYKGYIPIGILGQVDDLISITEAGIESHQMNSYLDMMTADKYLQFGYDKLKQF